MDWQRIQPVAVVFLLACDLCAQPNQPIQPIAVQRRLAFVVGNSAYPDAPLKNPGNDAQDLGAALERLGFRVTLRQNLGKREFDREFEQFTREVRDNDLALFYFSGHGMQVQNENYLLPVDARISSESDVEYEAYPASRVRRKLEDTRARVRVLILDACRNNPYSRFARGTAGGLAAMTNAVEGTLIAFAAGDSQTAADNPRERNGLFTKYLLTELARPGQSLKEVFGQVRAEVYQASAKKQLPALYDMVVGRLVLKEGAEVAPAPPPPAPAPVSSKASPPVAPSLPAPGRSKVNQKDGLTYLWIPPGRFTMGCSPGDNNCRDNEKPTRQIEIPKGFWMGQTEVTQAAYQRVTGQNESEFRGEYLPVEQVTWDEARRYCQAVEMRLPTDAEWEYAARAGNPSAQYGPLNDIAWYAGNSDRKTHPVGQKQPNQFGLYDMLGNVREWVGVKDYLRGGGWSYLGAVRPRIDPSLGWNRKRQRGFPLRRGMKSSG